MPPWNRPNRPDTTYSGTRPSNGRNKNSATPCSTEPSISVRSPPMWSDTQPDSNRLAMPAAIINDSICAPCAAPKPRSVQ
ncbi:MAG: hypothetical protein BWX79_03322 [Alphaproteobacteria bacterium ADurb.Bin100]|nr:MAG: hypothetical protein BWX79_03322 [Alphaproteobacteria bacterium ADurb.Bin100]